jgi:competence protein ComEA
VGLALAGALLLAAFLVANQTERGSVEIRTAAAGGGAESIAASTGPGIVVDVAGAVRQPGVYSLPPGARVGDAIAAAGGYGPRVDATVAERELNLAAPLKDGARIRVPSRDDPPPVTAAEPSAGRAAAGGGGTSLVNLNKASAQELDALPGIGPATAAKILAARAEQPFASVDELLERKVVSSRVLESLRDLVTAG